MKRIILILLILSIPLLHSCKREKEELTTTAVKVLKSPERVKVINDLHLLRTAIQTYRIEHNGENPPSLKSLNVKLYYPDEYIYDRETGKVRSKKYPEL